MNEQRHEYADFIKMQKREMSQVQEAYQNVCAWLAFSAMLNVVLLACWLMGIGQ